MPKNPHQRPVKVFNARHVPRQGPPPPAPRPAKTGGRGKPADAGLPPLARLLNRREPED